MMRAVTRAIPILAVTLACVLAPGQAVAGRVTAVTPLRVSADATLNISATGLDVSAANNRVTFTPQGGAPVDALATSVGTVDAAAGVRRIGVRVPRGLPAGSVSVRVTNLASGEVTEAGVVQLVVLEIAPASLVQGAGPVPVVIRSSPNGVFATTGTRVVFGPGVTVHSARVDSPTQLTTSVSVAESAPLGRLTVATLTNGQTAFAPDGFEVRAAGAGPANAAPTVQVAPATPVTLPAGVTLSATVTDDGLPNPPAAVALSWTQVSGPAGGTASFAAPGAATTGVTFSVAGTYVLRLTVNDSALSTSADVTVVVNPAVPPPPTNQAPTFTSTPPLTATVGTPYAYTATATDPDSDPVTFFLISGPAGFAIAPTGVVSWTPAANQVGPQAITIEARDGKGGTTPQQFSVTVSETPPPPPPTNQAPTFTSLPPLTATVGTPYAYTATATDPDSDPVTFFLISGPAGFAIAPTGVVSWTPAANQVGAQAITIEARDGKGGTTPQQFTVTVSETPPPPPPTNLSPIVSAGPDLTVTLPASALLSGTVTDDGLPQGAALSITWTRSDGPGLVTFANASSPSTSATFSAPGLYTLRLTASDSELSAFDEVLVTVNEPSLTNLAPTVDAGPDASGEVGAPIDLAGAVTDDGRVSATPALSWARLTGPGAVSFATPSSAQTTASFDAPGVYVLRLSADDGEFVSADTTTVTVTATSTSVADRAPPIVALVAPSEAVPGAEVEVRVEASDNVGVASVRVEIDDQSPMDMSAAPFTRRFTVPQVAVPGTIIAIVASARDAAGNVGRVSAQLTITSSPDTELPAVQISGPQTTSPGAALRLSAIASDNVGIDEVTFLVGGQPIGTGRVPPYLASLLVAGDAAVGSLLTVTARARDFAGNEAESVLQVLVEAVADTTPPTVALDVPDETYPGALLPITATAADAGGIASVGVTVDEAQVATLTAPPYAASYRVPAGQEPGTTLAVVATATDFASFTATATSTVRVVAPPLVTRGVVTGEVYDDMTGLPLAGARVVMEGVDALGVPFADEAITDARGRYLLRGSAGEARLRVTRAGFTRVDRKVVVEGGQAVAAFDARLTPVASFAGRVSLTMLAGSLPGAVTLVPVSGQGLQGLLPLGWSPVGVADLWPHTASLAGAGTLRVTNAQGLGAGTPLVLVRFDEAVGAWRALGAAAVSSSGQWLEATVSATGQYAFLLADVQPQAPPAAMAGQVIAGVDQASLPATIATSIDPEPRILFYAPDAYSAVTGRVTATTPMTSGLPLVARITESYRFVSGDELHPEPYEADLVFYQAQGAGGAGATEVVAAFVASPSQSFEALSLERGVITVELVAEGTGAAPRGLVTSGGGVVDGPGGLHLALPAGAVSEATPLTLAALTASPVPLPDVLAFVAGAGVQVDRALARGGVLSMPVPAGLTDASRVVLVRVAQLGGQTRLLLAGVAQIEAGRLVADTRVNGQATALDGILEPGQYLFLRIAEPIGFVGGVVRGVAGTNFGGALITSNSLPIVSLSTSLGAYLAVARVGTSTFTARDLVKNDAGGAQAFVLANQVLPLGLQLVAVPPQVTSISPADGANGVALGAPVVVTFSEPIDPASVSGANLANVLLRTAAGDPVVGTASLSSNNSTLTFRPSAPLAPDAAYTLVVATGVRDMAGYELPAPVSVSFATIDTTPPPTPAAGTITASIPNAQGRVTVSATQGTADPRYRVFVDNLTRRTAAVALVEPNGSFTTAIVAGLTDKLRVRIVDGSGNETVQEIDGFRQVNADGSVSQVVTAEGGVVDGPEGTRATIRPGTFPDGAVVTINRIPVERFPLTLTPEQQQVFRLDGAIDIDFGGATPQLYVDLSIPAVGGETESMRWIVGQALRIEGQSVFSVVDTGKFRDGRITTASPPCPGVLAAGQYGLVRSQQSVGLNYSRIYTGAGRGLLIGIGALGVSLVGGPLGGLAYAASVFAVYANPLSEALCYPTLTSTATLTPNRTRVTVPGERLTPSDRLLRFTNRANPGIPAVTLARDVPEFVFDIPGQPSDDYRVTANGTDPVSGELAPAQVAGKVIVSPFGAGVRVRISPDGLSLSVREFVISNLTRRQEVRKPVEPAPFLASLSGGDGDPHDVTVTDFQGRARTLEAPISSEGSPFGNGNLVLRIADGSLDPTVTHIILSGNRIQGVVLPQGWQERGGLDFAFDGDPTAEWIMTLHYSNRAPFQVTLPRFTLTVADAASGKVLKTITAYAPPPDEPQGLPAISGDDRPPYVITGPSRLRNFDPSGELVFTFSEPMDLASLEKAVLLRDRLGNEIPGRVQLSGGGRVMRFIPAGGLRLGERYVFEIRGVDASAAPGTAPPDRAARDLAGNPMPVFVIDITMYTPERIGSWPGPEGPNPTGYLPLKHVTLASPTALQARADRHIFVTTGSSRNLLLFDTSDPARPRLQDAADGPISRQQAAFVPGAAFTRRDNQPFTGDLLLATRFDTLRSAVDFYGLKVESSGDLFFDRQSILGPSVPPLATKVLTENPDLVGSANRFNTVFGEGLARAVGFVKSSSGLTAYVAVDRIGIMAVDVAGNTPQRLVGERVKEGIYSGSFVDLKVENNQVFAIDRSTRRMVVLAPDLAELAVYRFQGNPRSVLVASGVTFDVDNDGFIGPDEVFRFAYVGLDNGMQIVDVTDLSRLRGVGFVPLPGVVRDLDLDVERRRAFVLLDRGQLEIGMVDVSSPFVIDQVDANRDGIDDRLIWNVTHEGANGLRVDPRRGLLYVAGFASLDIYAVYDRCCDLQIDLTAAPKPEVTGDRTVLASRERRGLSIGLEKGLRRAQSECGLTIRAAGAPAGLADAFLFDTGTGGCLWSGLSSCGSRYTPGAGSHAFVLLAAGAADAPVGVESRATCGVRVLTEEFIDPRSGQARKIAVDGVDTVFPGVSFQAFFEAEFAAGRYNVRRIDDRLPRTVASDFGLGRQTTLLRHTLDGHWVRNFSAATSTPLDSLTGPADFTTALRRLRAAGIPVVEGYELARLAEFQLAKGPAYLRFIGASSESSSLNSTYVAQNTAAATAGLQAALARIVADAAAQQRLLSVNVSAVFGEDRFNGLPLLAFDSDACLVPEPGVDPDLWTSGPCGSFDEYVLSAVARSMRPFGGQDRLQLFDEARLDSVLRFYRVKVGLEQITDERAADGFIRLAHGFVQWAAAETRLAYDLTLPLDPHLPDRVGNMLFAQGEVNEALSKATVTLVPRVANRGFTAADRVKVNLFVTPPGRPTSVVEDAQSRVVLPATSEQYLQFKKLDNGQLVTDADGKTIPLFTLGPVSQTDSPGQTGVVAFTIDLPDKEVKESDRSNNVGGTFFYALDVAGGSPPGTGGQIPSPYGQAVLAGDAECKPDARLTLRPVLILQPQAEGEGPVPLSSPVTLVQGQQAVMNVFVENSSATDATGIVTACDTYTGSCRSLGGLAGGDVTTFQIPIDTNVQGTFDILVTAYSSQTGVTRSGPFRVSVTCERYTLQGVDQPSAAVSTVMRGGTSLRHFRAIDRLRGVPLAGAIVTADVRGVNPTTYTFTTDANGFVGVYESVQDFKRGVAIPFSPTGGTEGQARVEVRLAAAGECGKPATYLLDFLPLTTTHSLKAGSSIGVGLKIATGKVAGGGNVGFSIGAGRTTGDLGQSFSGLTVSRTIGVNGSFGIEPKLFEAKVYGGGQLSVSAGQLPAETMALAGAIGDTFTFKDPQLMNEADKLALAGIFLDTALKGSAWTAPLQKRLIWEIAKRAGLDATSRRTGRNASVSGSLSSVTTLFSVKAGLVREISGTGGEGPGGQGLVSSNIGADLSASASAAINFGFSVDHQIFAQTLTGKFSLGATFNAAAALSLGKRSATTQFEAKNASQQVKDSKIFDLGKLEATLKQGLSIGGSATVSFGATTPYFLDPSSLPSDISGADVWLPRQISLGLATAKNFGYQGEAGGSANLGLGTSYSLGFTVTNKDLIRNWYDEPSLMSAIVMEEQRRQLPALGVPVASPGELRVTLDAIADTFGRFYASIVPDGTFSKTVEHGDGIEVPIGLDVTFLGEGVEGKVGVKFDEAVSYPLIKGVMRDDFAYVTEEYPEGLAGLVLAPAVSALIAEAVGKVADVVRQVRGLLSSPSGGFVMGAAEEPHRGPQAGPPGSTGRVVELPGRVRIEVAEDEQPGSVTNLLSFDFDELLGPVVPLRYDPLDMSGPAGKPHYGVGGFHQFNPIDRVLTRPAQLTIWYGADEVTPAEEATLAIYRWEPDALEWTWIGGTLDTANRRIFADVAELGTYTVAPRMPAGEPVWTVLGVTRSGSGNEETTTVQLRSGPLSNNDRSLVGSSAVIHVRAVVADLQGPDGLITLGEVLTPDVDPVTDGVQVVTSADSSVDITVRLPGRVVIFAIDAFSDLGTAGGVARIALPLP